MKLKIYTLLIALCAAWSLQSCDNDDDESIAIPAELQVAFSSKYPNVTNVKWETKAGYYVADFYDGYETSAWFTTDGKWHMTETDIPYTALPDPVKTAFEASEYSTWKKDDVDKLERQGIETIYVIEVENHNQEVDLYYSADGMLIKSIVDTDDDSDHHLPPIQLSAAMETFINERYTGARIVEVDVENDRNDWDFGFTEVDIIHFDSNINRNISKEVLFDKNGEWYSTSWDVRRSELPASVTNTINNQYAGYQIDDAEYFEMATGTAYYLIELEGNNSPDIDIKVTADGTVINKIND